MLQVDLVRMKHQLLSVAADLTRTFHPEQERVIGREELEKGDDKCWPFFQEVFMISALTGDGVEKLKVCVCVGGESRWRGESSCGSFPLM